MYSWRVAMSSSSRKNVHAAAATVGALAVGTTAAAAEVYYQPIISLSSAYNSNIDLEPTTARRSAVGYFADAATSIGIATPQSETFLQPRLQYNYYPTATDRNRLEGF